MLLIDFSRICLTDCRPIWQLPSLPCPTTFDQVLLETGSWNCFIPPWRSSSVRFGDQVVVTVTTVKLSVDCICSGRIVLFAPVEHPVFVPITFFQLSHLARYILKCSHFLLQTQRLIAATCHPERGTKLCTQGDEKEIWIHAHRKMQIWKWSQVWCCLS